MKKYDKTIKSIAFILLASFFASFAYFASAQPSGGMNVDAKINRSSFNKFNYPYLLVYFGYVECPVVCPKRLTEVKTLYSGSAELRNIGFVMVDVDENDNPAKADKYAKSYNSSFDGIWFENAVLQPILKDFGAFAVKSMGGKKEIEHTDLLYLLKKTNDGYAVKAVFKDTPTVGTLLKAAEEN